MYGEIGIKDIDYVIDPKVNATRNFHGQYYLDSDKVVPSDHGYDESKPESELALDDMQRTARFRLVNA